MNEGNWISFADDFTRIENDLKNNRYSTMSGLIGGLAGLILGGVLGMALGGIPGAAFFMQMGFMFSYGRARSVHEMIIPPNDFNSKSASESAEETSPPVSREPLVIDLNRDGKTDVSGVQFFDLDVNGRRELTAWAGEGDGILVFDKNGSGIIEDGSELFGDHYLKSDSSLASSGFDALSDLDSNGDVIIDENDVEFANIKIWANLDDDGIFSPDELISLEDAGIASIDLSDTIEPLRQGAFGFPPHF